MSSPGAAPKEFQIQLEGRVKTFAAKMPVNALVDISGEAVRVYLYCWIDETRGQGAHVHYNPSHIALEPTNPALRHDGWYSLTMTVRDGDPDLLKVMACMRMKDQETKNTRNATLAVGGTLLQRLLAGEEQSFTMHDQFVQGNYTEVVMRVARSEPAGDLSQLALSRSSLWDIDTVFQPVVQENSNTIMNIFVSNHMQPTKGGAGFLAGLTRSVCFITLFLGTPAYVLLLAAGSGAGPPSTRPARTLGPPSTRSPRTSARSPRTTRS
jgi:hypothetical protein